MKQHFSPQIPFDFDLPHEMSFENFFIGENQQLINNLEKVSHGRGDSFIYLWGKSGVGKTHLLQACIQTAGQKKLSSFYLPLSNKHRLAPQIFDDLESMYLVCIDDVDGIMNDHLWENAFFDFYNRMMETKKRLIISSQKPPAQLSAGLPDLQSRLCSGIVYQVHELSELETVAALSFRAKQLGILLSDSVLHYLITHYRRDLGSLTFLLSDLDEASLKLKRKITIPFIKEILQIE